MLQLPVELPPGAYAPPESLQVVKIPWASTPATPGLSARLTDSAPLLQRLTLQGVGRPMTLV